MTAILEPDVAQASILQAMLHGSVSFRDMDALRDLVEAADETACDRVGLIGFCMGGMYAFKAAGLRRFDRIASFYGMIRVPEAWQGAGQEEPLQYLARPGASPVLAIIGEKDHYTPPDDVAELEKAYNEA